MAAALPCLPLDIEKPSQCPCVHCKTFETLSSDAGQLTAGTVLHSIASVNMVDPG